MQPCVPNLMLQVCEGEKPRIERALRGQSCTRRYRGAQAAQSRQTFRVNSIDRSEKLETVPRDAAEHGCLKVEHSAHQHKSFARRKQLARAI